MADARNSSKFSPHDRRPHSLSSGGNTDSMSHVRLLSMHDDRFHENSQSLRGQLEIRDQTISSLRAEQHETQAVCDRLQTKSQVMDRELATLIEENAELRKQVSSLSIQIENLTREKEALQNQSQADAAQWRQIMAMSSRLQMQSVEETRRFNSERESWIRERSDLESRAISAHFGGSSVLQRIDMAEDSDASSSITPLHRSLSLALGPENQAQRDVNSLRERCRELEVILTSILKESVGVERAAKFLKEARRRLETSGEAINDDDDGERKRMRS